MATATKTQTLLASAAGIEGQVLTARKGTKVDEKTAAKLGQIAQPDQVDTGSRGD